MLTLRCTPMSVPCKSSGVVRSDSAHHVACPSASAKREWGAGVKRRVFAPYHEPRKQQERGVLAMGLAAVALMGAGEGFRIAHSASLDAISAAELWLPVALR